MTPDERLATYITSGYALDDMTVATDAEDEE